ncbi:hypothetical protein [Pseudomonas sp.]|uniref:hypothetical protein n=1 Tax=Pseudomonas sp. TaxID=306 RepID=UPI00272C62B2|nr:hypothetical protein [Pseudomonas sp.]
MDDPFENQLREMLREADRQRPDSVDAERLERVLHKAHIHGGLFDLLNMFARWGWVLSEAGTGLKRKTRPTCSTEANHHKGE